MKKIFDWIINHFTYIQIYIFICLLFLTSLVPIGYFWIETHLDHIDLIDEQLKELKEESLLKDLFKQIQQHRLLVQRYFTVNKDSLGEIRNLDHQIRQTLRQIEELDHLKSAKFLTNEALIWQKMNTLDLQNRWNKIEQKFPRLTSRESESLHTTFLHDILIQFSYIADRVGISYFTEIDKYVMVESLFLRLPSIQENLSQMILISEKILSHPSKELARDRVTALADLIQSDLDYLEHGMEVHAGHNLDEEKKRTLNLLGIYHDTILNLLRTIKTRILATPEPIMDLAEFQTESGTVLNIGYQLWDMGLTTLTEVFKTEKSYILYRLWLVLLTTLLLTIFAFFLGLALTYTGIIRLSQLTQATDSFTNGDLTIRVPAIYQDEIGRQAQAFNRMAQKLEEIVNHLYELLDATSALANGDLTARIRVCQHDNEFDQVASSFNKMAEIFETIISRLQQIGMMLTTSASEIASASKEQETIVVEQEANIREIALAAHDISSTAKEYANTMNEVNQTAEQTSSLALKGKDSLNHMEFIMRHMVEASTNIAAKLAILNEKASNITSVITTITKVADQTNLLSLNASIEAEKAGDYGRSFAVIAREIRRLADQTAIATLDIEKMVNEIMTAVSISVIGVDDFTQEIRNGVEQVRTVSEQLTTIIEQVQAFTARFEFVNQGMQTQSTGAQQINDAIAKLSSTAQQTSEALHQFHKTVQELNQAANELSILNSFKSQILEEELSSLTMEENPLTSFQPTSKETMRKFNKTISNLNVAATKLKNLNIQLRPPLFKNEDNPSSS